MSDPVQPSLLDRLRPAISDARLSTYLTAAGFDEDRALALYLWNVQIGEALHLPIQAVEVALRNRIHATLSETFGPAWWSDPALGALLDSERATDLGVVLRRIRNRKLPLNDGQVVAGLSFGFWVGMLQKRYSPPLWSGRLHQAFPDYPSTRNRATLAKAGGRVAWLRNRIWHHEPIIHLDLSAEYGGIMALLAWLSGPKAEWIRANSRVPALLRVKP